MIITICCKIELVCQGKGLRPFGALTLIPPSRDSNASNDPHCDSNLRDILRRPNLRYFSRFDIPSCINAVVSNMTPCHLFFLPHEHNR